MKRQVTEILVAGALAPDPASVPDSRIVTDGWYRRPADRTEQDREILDSIQAVLEKRPHGGFCIPPSSYLPRPTTPDSVRL